MIILLEDINREIKSHNVRIYNEIFEKKFIVNYALFNEIYENLIKKLNNSNDKDNNNKNNHANH